MEDSLVREVSIPMTLMFNCGSAARNLIAAGAWKDKLLAHRCWPFRPHKYLYTVDTSSTIARSHLRGATYIVTMPVRRCLIVKNHHDLSQHGSPAKMTECEAEAGMDKTGDEIMSGLWNEDCFAVQAVVDFVPSYNFSADLANSVSILTTLVADH